MGTTKMWYMDETCLGAEATKIKNLIAAFLRNHDYITEEVYNDFSLNYGIIIKKPSFFHRFWKKRMFYKTHNI